MTFFNEVNEDAKTIAPDQAAQGPRVGFLDSWEASWNAQVRTSAENGIASAYADEEDAQRRAMKKAGIENMPSIGIDSFLPDISIFGDDDAFMYKQAARFQSGNGTPEDAARMETYDKRIDELRKLHPDLGLKTSREMYDAVVSKGRAAEEIERNQRRTFGGEVGAFLGGAVASMNPRTDPLNAMTMGVGGPGKTALMRIGSEAGLQGLVEGLNQVTGVQEQREMMGLSNGVGDAFGRVAGTAIAGGVLQGAGEGLAFAGRRWFKDAPLDPAPPPPPPKEMPQLLLEGPNINNRPEWEGQAQWEKDVAEFQQQQVRDLMSGVRDYTDDIIPMANYGQTRQGSARARMDIDHVAQQLDRWDGDLPHQIKPRTMTAIPNRVDGVTVPEIKIDTPGAHLDAMAREYDPKLFNVFDRLADRKAEFQRWLQDPRFKTEQTAAAKKAEAQVEELSRSIENLKYNMGKVGNRRRAEMQVKLDNLMEQRAAAAEKMTIKDTPEMKAIRMELLDTDQQMRDLAPMVGRAYAHAREKWDLDAPEREQIRQMIREGRKDLPQGEAPAVAVDKPSLDQFTPTLQDKAPILRQAPQVEAQMRDGADAADYAAAIVKKNMETMDEAITSYRASLDSIVKSAKDGVVTINGQQFKFDLDADTIHIPNEDGTGSKRVTIRELLEDNADTEAELKATQTCSIL